MNSYAKEGQDAFVSSLIKTPGFFLDVGAAEPIKDNNTYLLETLGWNGLLIDNNPVTTAECQRIRKAKAFCIDVSTLDWRTFLKANNVPTVIDYLSLDVDDANVDVLKNFPFDTYTCKVITFETDLYKVGNARKTVLEAFMASHPSYVYFAENVSTKGLAFEDWIVHTSFFDADLLEKRTKDADWKNILAGLSSTQKKSSLSSSVQNFYQKENDLDYSNLYNSQHRPRFDFLFSAFELGNVRGLTVADFGGGMSELLTRLNTENEKHCFEGATLQTHNLPFTYHQCDLNYPIDFKERYFDLSMITEVLEHLASPYTAMEEIKKLTKIGGRVLITIPHVRMLHNSPNFPLFYPETNFEDWLDQMALPRLKKVLFDGDWPSWCYLCENRPWSEKKLAFPKDDIKFINATPLEVTNI